MRFNADFSKAASALTGTGPMGVQVRITLTRTRDDDFDPDVFYQGDYTGLEHRGHFSGASTQMEKVLPTGEEALRWAKDLEERIKRDLEAYRKFGLPAKIDEEF